MTVDVPSPYLLFLGDITELPYAKTALGLRDWAPEKCVGEYALPGATVTTGLTKLNPTEAHARGARSLVIGVANRGGTLNPEWLPALLESLEAGLDIVSGMHARLADNRELDAAARRLGRRLIDVRRPPPGIPIASGRKRSGKRLLTVGTDCALGKKYTALVLAREFRRRGVDADFRASGQTGILIAGSGIPLDAVVSDFVAGAAELLSPDADDDHWDVVEGQGSLFHPSYAGVSLGLLHGTQPDVIVLCHEEGRDRILGLEELSAALARRSRLSERGAGAPHESPCALCRRFLNTSGLDASRARAVLAELQSAARHASRGSDAQRAGTGGAGRIMSVTQPLARVTLQVDVEKWPLKAPFRITGYTFVEIDVVIATISCGGHTGRGEAAGVYYRSENAASMVTQIEAVRGEIEAGIDREALRRLLPAGGARNAVDCALWDLEARLSGMPAWKIAGLDPPVPLVTTFTLGAEDPEQMARTAMSYAGAQAIKLKLTGTPIDADRVRAVRAARPEAWLGVDANQGFTRASLADLMPVLVDARVGLIEQPFPIGRESDLDGLRSPIPIAADESAAGSEGCRRARRPLRRRQHQARQERRTHRGARDGAAGARTRPRTSWSAT